LIFCHGFKGFKDWGAFPLMAQCIAEQGLACVRFNFSLNGVSAENFQDITLPEVFGKNNLSTELDDLGVVIDWIKEAQEEALDRINRDSVHLAGHSRGGGIALLRAIEDSRVRSVTMFNGVSDFEPYMHWIPQEEWKEIGVSWAVNSRTGQKLPMYYQFVDDFYLHRKRLDIPELLTSMNKPLLLIHAEDDNVVLPEAAQSIYNEVEHAILVELENGGHTLGASHPWTSTELPAPLQEAVEECIEFVNMNR
jgi:pimeloyl-ACP methyl ester carboxylesterase